MVNFSARKAFAAFATFAVIAVAAWSLWSGGPSAALPNRSAPVLPKAARTELPADVPDEGTRPPPGSETESSEEEISQSLEKIEKAVRENPGLKETALSFYESCASRSDVPKSIRARCYSNLKSLAMSAIFDEDEGN